MTTRALTSLFRSISAQDFESAKSVALEICKAEEKRGHHVAARQLRGALSGTTGTSYAVPHVANLVSTALVRVNSPLSLSEVTLPTDQRRVLQEVSAEWRISEELQKQGIQPRSKILFHGPPGCGKSLTAQALGQAMNLPVYLVRFDAIIGAFLGQTAIHLRQLFAFAEANPCILLLDEIDALGKRRGNPLDVGELDRIVISLLQELEHARPKGLVVATTNLAEHLDDALWRRFDLAIEFKRPSASALRKFGLGLAAKFAMRLDKKTSSHIAASRSFAETERIVIDLVRARLVRKLGA